jgi:hypothetical protein
VSEKQETEPDDAEVSADPSAAQEGHERAGTEDDEREVVDEDCGTQT